MLKKILQKWAARPKAENIPFTRKELKEEADKSLKFRLINFASNRAERRYPDNPKQIRNNRKKTAGRAGNAVLNKMAYYWLRLEGYRNGFKTLQPIANK